MPRVQPLPGLPSRPLRELFAPPRPPCAPLRGFPERQRRLDGPLGVRQMPDHLNARDAAPALRASRLLPPFVVRLSWVSYSFSRTRSLHEICDPLTQGQNCRQLQITHTTPLKGGRCCAIVHKHRTAYPHPFPQYFGSNLRIDARFWRRRVQTGRASRLRVRVLSTLRTARGRAGFCHSVFGNARRGNAIRTASHRGNGSIAHRTGAPVMALPIFVSNQGVLVDYCSSAGPCMNSCAISWCSSLVTPRSCQH